MKNDIKIRIIEEATDLFFQKGFYKVTLTEIAKRSKISQPGIYNHFDGMDDIMISACVYWLNEGRQWIEERVDARERARRQLMEFLAANVTYTSKNRQRDALILGLTYYATHSAQALATYQMIVSVGQARYTSLIIRGNQDRSWDVKEPEQMGRMIFSLLLAELIDIIVGSGDKTLKSRIKRFTDDVLSLLPELKKD